MNLTYVKASSCSQAFEFILPPPINKQNQPISCMQPKCKPSASIGPRHRVTNVACPQSQSKAVSGMAKRPYKAHAGCLLLTDCYCVGVLE